MQTSLKDLVMPWSRPTAIAFWNYPPYSVKSSHCFLTTEQRGTVSCEEFADYLSWAAENLTTTSPSASRCSR